MPQDRTIFCTILCIRTISSCTFNFLIEGCGAIEREGDQHIRLKSEIGRNHNKLKWVAF